MLETLPIEVLGELFSFFWDRDIVQVSYASKSLRKAIMSGMLTGINVDADVDDFRALFFLHRKSDINSFNVNLGNDTRFAENLAPLIIASQLRSFSLSYCISTIEPSFDTWYTCILNIIESLNTSFISGRARNLQTMTFNSNVGLSVPIPQTFFANVTKNCSYLRRIDGFLNLLDVTAFTNYDDESNIGFFQQIWTSLESLNICEIGRVLYVENCNHGIDGREGWLRAWHTVISNLDQKHFPKLVRIVINTFSNDDVWILLSFFETVLLSFRSESQNRFFSQLEHFEFNFPSDSRVADTSQLWTDTLRKFNIIPSNSERSLDVFRLPVVFSNARSIKFNVSIPSPCVCDIFRSSLKGCNLEIQETIASTQYSMTSKLLSRLACADFPLELNSISIKAPELDSDVAFYDDYSSMLLLPSVCPLVPAIFERSNMLAKLTHLNLYSLWFSDEFVDHLLELKGLTHLTIVHGKLKEGVPMYSYEVNVSFMEVIITLFQKYILSSKSGCKLTCLNIQIPCESEWVEYRGILETFFISIIDIGDFSILLHTLNRKEARSHSPLPDNKFVQEVLRSIDVVHLTGYRSALIYNRLV